MGEGEVADADADAEAEAELFAVDAMMLLGTLMVFGQEFPAPPEGVIVVV